IFEQHEAHVDGEVGLVLRLVVWLEAAVEDDARRMTSPGVDADDQGASELAYAELGLGNARHRRLLVWIFRRFSQAREVVLVDRASAGRRRATGRRRFAPRGPAANVIAEARIGDVADDSQNDEGDENFGERRELHSEISAPTMGTKNNSLRNP